MDRFNILQAFLVLSGLSVSFAAGLFYISFGERESLIKLVTYISNLRYRYEIYEIFVIVTCLFTLTIGSLFVKFAIKKQNVIHLVKCINQFRRGDQCYRCSSYRDEKSRYGFV